MVIIKVLGAYRMDCIVSGLILAAGILKVYATFS